MISKDYLTYHPKLKPHTFSPSADHPTEFVLILDEDGAALGITHTEKRIIELFDGSHSMAEITQTIVHDNIAPLTALRRLLWDLARYGFLEERPWKVLDRIPGWGYWGSGEQTGSSFRFIAILGPLEKYIGKFLISPLFHIIAAVVFGFSLWRGRALLSQVNPFLINDSVAWAVLVVMLSILSGCLIASWFTVMILRAIYPAPVSCLADYKYGIPLFRLDGRRLRAQPCRKALFSALSPVIGILFISAVCLLAASVSEGVRREWLCHLAGSLWLAVFLLTAPWNSTILSREVLLRLRENNIFLTMTHAVRKAFQALISNKLHGVSHETLFLGWGIWTVLGSMILIRLIAMVFRWELPILVNHFLMEENRIILVILCFVLAVGAAAVTASIISFFVWIGRVIIREVRHRYWPHKDHLIIGLGVVCLSVLFVQIVWGNAQNAIVNQNTLTLFWGLILILFSILSWRSDGKGIEPLINFFPMALGLLLSLGAIGDILFLSKSLSASTTSVIESNISTAPHSFLYNISLYLHHSILALFIVYLIGLCSILFPPNRARIRSIPIVILASIAALAGGILLAIWVPFPQGGSGLTARILTGANFTAILWGTVWCGLIRNFSTPTLSLSILIIYISVFWNSSTDSLLTNQLLTALGTVYVLGGFFLRVSALVKTSLGRKRTKKTLSPTSQWLLPDTCSELQTALTELYHIPPGLDPPKESNIEAIRSYIQTMTFLIGPIAMRAIAQRFALASPWYATQQLFGLIPVSVKVPKLTDMSPERVAQSLKKVPTFAHAGDEIKQIISIARFEHYPAGETLIHQGDKEGRILIVVEGKISVEADLSFGHSTLAIFSAGDFVGEIGFLSGAERTASVRALQKTLVLSVDREDIDDTMPKTLAAIREAEQGESWLLAFSRANVFNEFPSSLNARVCLESQPVSLDRGQSLWLESKELSGNIAVYLSGKGKIDSNGKSRPLQEGMLLGLEECLCERPPCGLVRAEEPSRILLVDRTLFLEALSELLTPSQVLEATGEKAQFPPDKG